MSPSHNYAALAFKENLKNHPEDFIVTEDTCKQVEEAAKKRREWDAKANPPKPEPVRVEYARLRQQLYTLKENAKNTETRLNHAVVTVHHFEKIIAGLLKKKKAATAADLLGDERSLERQTVAAECELQDAREALTRWQRLNTSAAHALKAFDGHARIKELQKALGA